MNTLIANCQYKIVSLDNNSFVRDLFIKSNGLFFFNIQEEGCCQEGKEFVIKDIKLAIKYLDEKKNKDVSCYERLVLARLQKLEGILSLFLMVRAMFFLERLLKN